jgi:hypothetical protein
LAKPVLRLVGEVPERLDGQHRHAAQSRTCAEVQGSEDGKVQKGNHARRRLVADPTTKTTPAKLAPKATPLATESMTTNPVTMPGGDNSLIIVRSSDDRRSWSRRSGS